jgi:hypothetical protein
MAGLLVIGCALEETIERFGVVIALGRVVISPSARARL